MERLNPFDRSILKPTTAALVAFGSGVLLGHWYPPGTNVAVAAGQAIVVTVVFAGVLLAMRLPDDDQLVIRRAVEKVRSFRPGRRRGRGTIKPTSARTIKSTIAQTIKTLIASPPSRADLLLDRVADLHRRSRPQRKDHARCIPDLPFEYRRARRRLEHVDVLLRAVRRHRQTRELRALLRRDAELQAHSPPGTRPGPDPPGFPPRARVRTRVSSPAFSMTRSARANRDGACRPA